MRLPPSVQRPNVAGPADLSLEAEVERLRARLERERRSRLEAEAIAERGLRELFKRQQELLVVEAVAEAANAAPTVDETMRFALEKFCEFAGWPVGHLYVGESDPLVGASTLVPTTVWYVSGRDRYDALRVATASLRFPAGSCLPGRVSARREPVWIADVRQDPEFLRADAAAACGLRFAFAFPIRVGAEVAAVLEFFAEEAPTPNEDLLRLAAHLGTQLGRVIERQRAADRLIDAYQDPLTGLPNRALLLEDLELAIRRQKQLADCQFAVLFLDLDRFKVVNDSLGHLAGDRLIVEFARRINGCVRHQDDIPTPPGPERRADTVARLGGDEFVVLLSEIKDISDAVRVAERILRALEPPFNLDGQQLTTSASIGIAMGASGYEAAQDILRDADSAMYRAKASGKARYEVFDPAMHERAVARLQLEADLRLALQRDELRLHYQPIMSLTDERIAGFEALIRWQHPERGLLRPADFISVAEETGLIQAIGHWTLDTACRQMRRWMDRYKDERLWIAVNVSARQFADPALASFIAEVLRSTGLPAINLSLELTESVAMERGERSAHALRELKQLGLRIAIDDFGTGFSSLSYLHRFPVDALKMDSAFVSRLQVDPASREIVRAIIALAVALNLAVVAEGIETARDLALLRQMGCDFGQGYYLARPVDAGAVDAFVESHHAPRSGDP